MNIRNCVKCGKIFNYSMGKPICPNCRQSLEELFKETRLYIKRNPKASIAEVSQACEVEVSQIKQWVREERLSFSSDSAIGIDCELCGKTIRTGRFCDECKGNMSKDLMNATKRSEPMDEMKENPFARDKVTKMNFRDKDKDKDNRRL